MPFGQIVIGPPGSGKTTYCWGLYQFFQALHRPILIVNLDPASKRPPYPHAVDISSLISLQDCMRELELGPNGGMLYCLEYLERNLDWLEEQLDETIERALRESGDGKWRREEMYVVFDTPGQVELSTNHQSLKNVLDFLQKKMQFRLAAIHLTDSSHILDASKYISILLLSLRTMLQLELPHINVLSKIDLLALSGDLPFNLDFYTEVQDLHHLLPLVDTSFKTNKYSELNERIVDVVEEFGLVSFETLAVEDKESMMSLVSTIDQALGYRPPAPPPSSTTGHARGDDDMEGHDHDHDDACTGRDHGGHGHTHTGLPSRPVHVHQSVGMNVSTVQERWVDHRAEYDAFERAEWERQGDELVEAANRKSQRDAQAQAEAQTPDPVRD